jgi:putative ABC transport system permease protein
MAAPAIAAAFGEARRGLRARRRRAGLAALGIALAAAMLSAAAVIGDGLGLGFDRAVRAANLPDMIVRFDPQAAGRVTARIAALPDIAGYTLRSEVANVGVAARGRERDDTVAEVVEPGPRRGYAVVAGRALRSVGAEILVERGFAEAWGIHLGSRVFVDGVGWQTVVGFAEAPDNVGFPLGKPRFYVSRQTIDARFGADREPRVNLAEIWLRDPRYLDQVLVQARATSFGLQNVQFATRSGVRVLMDQAAGIVIDLLVALSVIALVTAGVMLAASARAEVQRRLSAIGVRRAVGASPGFVASAHGLEAALIAVPAATLGCAAGVLATYGAVGRLLMLLNEPAPGTGLALPLLGTWLAAVGVPVIATAWPAWRAAGGPVVTQLRGADVSGTGSLVGQVSLRGGGLGVMGARLVGARRVRFLSTVTSLGLSTAFVLLLLALASALSALETDPGVLGKRYQLTASLPPDLTPRVRAIAGVQAAAPRYEARAADSFSLGETIDLIAYPGDHTVLEAPAIVSGRRLRGSHEAEVGAGLAAALGLAPGSTLAIAVRSGTEVRLRVAGVVSSLEHDGRVAYLPASALLAADPSAPSQTAVRLRPGASQSGVIAALTELGGQPTEASTATSRGAPLVRTLRTILLAVVVVDGLVCLYALIQACALTVQERRRTVAVLRACGAGPVAVRRLLRGAVLALVVPAAALGVLLERLVLGPVLAHLAASYATLALEAGPDEVLVAAAGLAVAAAVAVAVVARHAARESVVAELA